jgi:hypothetical protein
MPFLRTIILHPLERQPGAVVRSESGLPIVAKTLGEAIESAEKYFNVRIVVHDPPKWFRVSACPVITMSNIYWWIFMCAVMGRIFVLNKMCHFFCWNRMW